MQGRAIKTADDIAGLKRIGSAARHRHDAARTVAVGSVSEERKRLLDAILLANRHWLPRFFPDG